MAKNQSYVLFALFATVLLLANAIPLAAAQPMSTNIKYKGQSADAYWHSEENGIYTDVYIFASEYATKEKSDKYTSSGAYVGIYQYTLGSEVCQEWDGTNYCWNEYIPIKSYFGYSEFASGAFVSTGKLGGATLVATIPGYDYLTDSQKSITINAQWTGLGEYSTGKYSYNYHSSTYSYKGQYSGTDRAADVSATISGDISMNLGSSMYGYLHDTKAGYSYVTNF
jgi:hypothetical protein